jgi:hypothetical protein
MSGDETNAGIVRTWGTMNRAPTKKIKREVIVLDDAEAAFQQPQEEVGEDG